LPTPEVPMLAGELWHGSVVLAFFCALTTSVASLTKNVLATFVITVAATATAVSLSAIDSLTTWMPTYWISRLMRFHPPADFVSEHIWPDTFPPAVRPISSATAALWLSLALVGSILLATAALRRTDVHP